MFKRLTWTGVGLVAGFACSKWVEHKVRRRLARYLPAGLRSLQTSAEVRDVARELASTRLAELRHAVKEGRRAMAERELDLRRQLVGAAPAGEELVPAQRRGHAC